MRKSVLSILLSTLILCPVAASELIDGLWYELNDGKHTAVVTCSEQLRREGQNTYNDAVAIEVPAEVVHNGKKYKVLAIGEYAFDGAAFTAVTIAAGVQRIDKVAFANCRNLMEVNIPATVVSIGEMAFVRCSSMKSIVFPDKLKQLEPQVLYECTALSQVVLGKGVTRIGDGAFAGCTALRSIALPDGVTHIGVQAFYRCTALKNIGWSKKIRTLGEEAFAECTALEVIRLPETLADLPGGVFKHCIRMRNVEIPESIVRIDDDAFAECQGLTAVVLLSKRPPMLGKNVFREAAVKGNYQYIIVPCGALEVYQEQWETYKKSMRDGCL